MVPKLTLDGGLLRESTLLPAVRTLKTWESEGRLEMFESDRAKMAKSASTAYTWPGATAPVKPASRFRMPRRAVTDGASFQRISAVLFPMRDPHRLNMTEVNDVAHLMHHHSSGHSIFVTTNVTTFISGGKQERLQSAFKIVALTPEDAVIALKQSESVGSRK